MKTAAAGAGRAGLAGRWCSAKHVPTGRLCFSSGQENPANHGTERFTRLSDL
jgi:hypothetical protein